MGTFGAVIRLRGRVRSARILMMIAAAGPLAGFAVALVTTAIGLTLSVPAGPHPVWWVHLNEPLLFYALQAPLHALGLAPDGPLLWHPVLLASWFGLLITSLNLVPAGQLDGGHILYALSPRVHKAATVASTIALGILGVFVWAPWLLWMVLLLLPAMRRTYVINRRHGYVFVHPQYDRRAPTGRRYVLLAPLCLVVALLCMIPRPFDHDSLLQMLHLMR